MTGSDDEDDKTARVSILLGALAAREPKEEIAEEVDATVEQDTSNPGIRYSLASRRPGPTRPANPGKPYKNVEMAVRAVAEESGVLHKPENAGPATELENYKQSYENLLRMNRHTEQHNTELMMRVNALEGALASREEELYERDARLAEMVGVEETEERIGNAVQEERERWRTLEGFFNVHVDAPEAVEARINKMVHDGVIPDKAKYVKMLQRYSNGPRGK
ncbi:hypothetical protein ACFL3V_03950 [Nanoarchaeota archaeon]